MGQWSRDSNEPPFIDLVPPEQAEGERKALYDELQRIRGPGRVSNLFRAYSAFPALGMANLRRLGVLLAEGSLSVKFKEGVMTALAEVNRCDYCVSFHATAMRNAGATDEEVQAALSFDPGMMGLSEKEQALFEFAKKANGDPHGTTRADVDACKQAGADDHDIIETLETVNTGNSFNLVNGALNIGADDFLSYMTGRGELTDMADYPRVNAVYEEAFAPNRPARTCVAVSVLPVRERMKIETVACKGRP